MQMTETSYPTARIGRVETKVYRRGKLFYVAKDIGGRANIAGPTVGI